MTQPKQVDAPKKPLRCSECGQFGHTSLQHVNWRDIAILCGDLSL